MALTQAQRLDRIERRLSIDPPDVRVSITTAEVLATAWGKVRPLSWCMAGMLLDMAEAAGAKRDPDPDAAPLRIADAGIGEAARRAVHGGPGYADGWFYAGEPFCFDFEMPEDRPPVYVPENVPTLLAYLRKFKRLAPGIPVGFWGMESPVPKLAAGIGLADWAGGIKKPEHKDAIARHADAFRPLALESDYVSVSAYVGEPQSSAVYLDAAAAKIEWARKAFGRPVWVWIIARYLFAEMYGLPPGLTDADAARVWAVAGAGDAKVIHPEPDWRAALAAYGGFL